MPDDADAGTADAGTQQTADQTAPGTVDTGTQVDAQTDSQPHTDTTPTTDQQVEGEAQAGQPTGDQKPANPWDSPENPYYKRFNDTQSHASRLYQEREQLAKQNQEYQERLQRFETQQKEAEAKAKMLPFQKSHPDYANTRERLGKVQAFKTAISAIDGADEATAKKLAQAYGLTADDFRLEREESMYRQKIDDEFRADPEGFVQARVESKIHEALQKYDEYLAARVSTERLITDPSNAKLIEAYAPQMSKIMDPQVSARDKAFEYAQVLAERDALKRRLGSHVEQVSQKNALDSMAHTQHMRGGRKTPSGQQYPEEARQDAVAWLKKTTPGISQDALLTQALKINAYFANN
jgi:hypothetical protein